MGSGPVKPTGSLCDRNDAASRPCMVWAAADIDFDVNAPLVQDTRLMPNSAIADSACGAPQTVSTDTIFSQNFCFGMRRWHAFFLAPLPMGKYRPSPPPMPSRVATSDISGRSQATRFVQAHAPNEFGSFGRWCGSFGPWCSPRPHSGPDPHRACQRKPLSYF